MTPSTAWCGLPGHHQDDLLLTTLELAVPMWVDQMRDWTPEERCRSAHADASVVASHGDALQFKGKTAQGRRHTREAFNALARGLAVGAYQPGGIDFAGRHWCVNHAECLDAETRAAANPLPEPSPARPTVTVHLPAGDVT